MNLYAHVKHGAEINDHANFSRFWTSMYLLFRMATGESYNGLMHDAMVTGDDCTKSYVHTCSDNTSFEQPSTCGSEWGAPLYFLSFFILSSLLMLNLLVAIILDNFGDTQTFENCAVQHEDLMKFAQHWSEFDPKATGFIEGSHLQKLIRGLPQPLGVLDIDVDEQVHAAKMKARRMDIPDRGGKVSFNETLSALCSLAIPTVILPDDLLHSEMMKDLIVKKNSIPAIRRDNTKQRQINAHLFEKRGRLFTMEERHFAEIIQARIRGAVQRARAQAQLRQSKNEAAVISQNKESTI